MLLHLSLIGVGHGCLPVKNGSISAADIASALPGLRAANSDAIVGYGPDPGYVRWWRGDELRRLAKRLGIANTLQDFCVQREVTSYSKQEVLAALRSVVPAGVQLELADYCRTPVPKGQLSFEWSSIAASTCGSGSPELVWRGQARFPVNRSMPFWAVVRIAVQRARIYSVSEIPARTLLKREELRQEWAPAAAFCVGQVESLESIEGMESIRRVPAGAALLSTDLRIPDDITSGDLVRVQAASDASKLEFTAKAVTRGRKGDMILISDLAHRRVFRARVIGRGIVDVDMDVLVASKPNRRRVEPGGPAVNSGVPR
ncbi:MAG: flagellar basal body P-ring formation chaperone FlgA [Fimbriimonadaceae bacterium]|nr:flagellar basal body P-ring formation chaperone FlgA [Fimbriimonadaceae bacterium]